MSRDVLLAIFAHPDDESLLAGGMLAAASAAGMDVVIVSATRGELGGGQGELAEVRPLELQAAGALLGAQSAYCLGLPDGALDSDPARIEGAVAEQFVRWEPAAVITFTLDGWYWHRDHMAVHRAVTTVAPDASPLTSVYVTSWPRHRMTRLARAARSHGAPAELWGLDPAAFGHALAVFDYVIDVTPFLLLKTTAIAAHASETVRGSLFTSLPAAVAQRYLGFEFLTLARSGRFDLVQRLAGAGVAVRDRRRRTRPTSPVRIEAA